MRRCSPAGARTLSLCLLKRFPTELHQPACSPDVAWLRPPHGPDDSLRVLSRLESLRGGETNCRWRRAKRWRVRLDIRGAIKPRRTAHHKSGLSENYIVELGQLLDLRHRSG